MILADDTCYACDLEGQNLHRLPDLPPRLAVAFERVISRVPVDAAACCSVSMRVKARRLLASSWRVRCAVADVQAAGGHWSQDALRSICGVWGRIVFRFGL